MSSAYLMNFSQTNNALLQNRVNQLTIQNNQLKKQIAEIENQQFDSETVINNYANKYTKNRTMSTNPVLISAVLPEDASSWKAQTCDIRNIKIVVDNEANTQNVVINLYDSFTYITESDRVSISVINIPISELTTNLNEPIEGINTFTLDSSAGLPFYKEQGASSYSLFTTTESSSSTVNSSNGKIVYDIGAKVGNVVADFESSVSESAKFSLSSASWIVRP